ncbi:MAG TPA: aldo/keto reductase [Candidatus Merdenecus merdavium]|nr:aldo/keto reductase [Candidatus Merdenecus merdavium]
MRKIKLGSSNLEIPVIAVGCMRINSLNQKQAEEYIQTALDLGANFFDHADIYGQGTCEEIFGDAVQRNGIPREKMLIQSKCGIVPGVMYDFSKEHILKSVDSSLKRLKTDYLDVLLLHRPDALVEPEEVAEAFDHLESTGKVRHFGVSNQNSMQMELLKKYTKQPLVANQLQFSITNSTMVDAGMNVNTLGKEAVDRDGSILDYCRLHDVTIQAWSPFQYGFFEGVFLGDDKYPKLNQVIDRIAKEYNVINTTIAMAWILRHPAKIQPIAGTMNKERLIEICKATQVTLTREEWYEIYLAAGHPLP